MIRPARALLVGLAALALGLAGLPAPPPATASPRPPAAKSLSVLTPRLQVVADGPSTGPSSQDQAHRLSLPASGPGSLARRGGRVLVEVRLTDTTPRTLALVGGGGSRVVSVDRTRNVVTVEVPPGRLRALAAIQPQVRSVVEVLEARTSAACPTGIVSEGDTQLAAAAGRAAYTVDGAGVTVGIVSDSYNLRGGAPADVSAAELPGSANGCGYTTTVGVQSDATANAADEGRAMAQIVHDLAPGATLRFATAVNGQSDMAQQIRGLAAAGAKVIVDDVGYLDEPVYQGGVIAKAIEDVTAQGVSYFSAAGNANVVVGGRDVGSYEAPAFRPMACPASVVAALNDPTAACHNFNAGGADNTYGIDGTITYTLGWSEPELGVSDDLDLFVLDSAGNVVGKSWQDSIATQQAVEVVGGLSGPLSLVVARAQGTGTPRLKLVSHGSALTSVEYAVPTGSDVVGPTLVGHGASPAAAAVAAVPYNNANTVEPFSSRGPAARCWGTATGLSAAPPITPCESENISMAATDGTANSFFGQLVGSTWRFYGTSAAAPHAAAVAALLRQKAPCLSPAQIRTVMRSTAAPVGSLSGDVVGAGLVDAYDALGAPALASCAPPTGPGRFTAVGPTRVLDTRSGLGTTQGRVGEGGSVTLQIPGLPADTTAVTLNVTAVDPTAASFITVYPAGRPRPGTSNLNFTAGQTIPNEVTVPVGPGGAVTFYNLAGSVDVVGDLAGYYSAGGGAGFVRTAPQRVLDTRTGVGAPAARVGPDASVTVTVPGLPATATAVTLNVTAVDASWSSFVTVYPGGQPRPFASNLNFTAGETIPNLVTVGVGAGGTVTLYNASGSVDLLADLAGYYVPGGGSAFSTVAPTRVLDTRSGLGAPQARVGPGQTLNLAGLPPGAGSVVLNVTAVDPSAAGYLTLYPAGTALPNASNLNFPAGRTIPNLVTVSVGSGGTVGIYNFAGWVDVLADIAGYFGA